MTRKSNPLGGHDRESEHEQPHHHSDDETDTGPWPSPPFLTGDEEGQIDKALSAVRAMLSKAVYHKRLEGHYCIFRCSFLMRDGYISPMGGIDCQGPAWGEAQSDLAVRTLNSLKIEPGLGNLETDLTGLVFWAEGKRSDGRTVLIFEDGSYCLSGIWSDWGSFGPKDQNWLEPRDGGGLSGGGGRHDG